MGVVYSVNIRSELTWKESESPAFIEMTVVDDGHMRLTALNPRSWSAFFRGTRRVQMPAEEPVDRTGSCVW